MEPAIRDQLLALNQTFYTNVADPFHATRKSLSHGHLLMLNYLPNAKPLRVLDAGCGNGRFAAALNSLGQPVSYTGVDANFQLLAYASKWTSQLDHIDAKFVQADLAQSNWTSALAADDTCYELVACLATLQHMPGRTLRQNIVKSFAQLLSPGGRLALTGWQFFTDKRLSSRLVDWAEIDLSQDDVEPGDGLLPWKQGVYAVRYVHQIDEQEMETLAQYAGLQIVTTYRADGKDDDLNLYAILEKT